MSGVHWVGAQSVGKAAELARSTAVDPAAALTA